MPRKHLIRAHHLRDRLRRHKRPDLDRVQPGADQRLDEGDARRDADRRLLVLKAVARADFDDAHLIAHIDSSACRFDFGQFDAFADDIADLAFDHLQHARERRAQGLFHLHHFQRENRRALFQMRAHLGQQRHDRTRQGCYDLVFADLLLVVAAERIDPMQVEAAVACPQV